MMQFLIKKTIVFCILNFEDSTDLKGEYSFINDVVYEGRQSAVMDSLIEYGPTYRSLYSKVTKEKDVFIKAEVWAMVEDTSNLNADLVYSIESNGKSIFWRSTKFKMFITEPGKWTKIYLSYSIPNILSGTEEIKIYVWKPGIHKLYLDNLNVSFTQR